MSTTFEPFAPWLRDLNRMLTADGRVAAFSPAADVLVSDDGVTVYMDVPGLGDADLEVELENDTLSVRGERPYPYADAAEASQVRRIERGFGRFERSLRVPRGMDPGTVEAALSDGVLRLHVPRPESLKPHRVPIRHDADEQRTLEGVTSSSEEQGA
jgi:HSP20 family protein